MNHSDDARLAEDADTAELVARFQSGERDLFAEIYARYFERVFIYLRMVFRNQHEAEDATQQVFLKVFEALPRYERRHQPFIAWLFIVARNHASVRLKREARVEPMAPADIESERVSAGENGPDPAGVVHAIGVLSDSDLTVLLRRLPIAQRQAIVMRFVLGLTNREIAEILSRRPEDIRLLQHRGLAFLRERLTSLGHRPEPRDRAPAYRRRVQSGVLRSRRFILSP